jgi:hypothetical protein
MNPMAPERQPGRGTVRGFIQAPSLLLAAVLLSASAAHAEAWEVEYDAPATLFLERVSLWQFGLAFELNPGTRLRASAQGRPPGFK